MSSLGSSTRLESDGDPLVIAAVRKIRERSKGGYVALGGGAVDIAKAGRDLHLLRKTSVSADRDLGRFAIGRGVARLWLLDCLGQVNICVSGVADSLDGHGGAVGKISGRGHGELALRLIGATAEKVTDAGERTAELSNRWQRLCRCGDCG